MALDLLNRIFEDNFKLQVKVGEVHARGGSRLASNII